MLEYYILSYARMKQDWLDGVNELCFACPYHLKTDILKPVSVSFSAAGRKVLY